MNPQVLVLSHRCVPSGSATTTHVTRSVARARRTSSPSLLVATALLPATASPLRATPLWTTALAASWVSSAGSHCCICGFGGILPRDSLMSVLPTLLNKLLFRVDDLVGVFTCP